MALNGSHPVTDTPETQEVRELLMALLAIAVEEREMRDDQELELPKAEVLLASVGLSNNTIASVLGKKSDAVRKALSRAKQSRN